MDMEFRKRLPVPKQLKGEYPMSDDMASLKNRRDDEIRDIFNGKDNRLLLI